MKALGLEIHNLTKYADYQQMEKVRARADILVKDAETAEALKPYYQQFCKRPCFHDDYLDTFVSTQQQPVIVAWLSSDADRCCRQNRESVTLVDTGGEGIERITPKGVVVNGQELEVDCIVMATGFVRRTCSCLFAVYRTTTASRSFHTRVPVCSQETGYNAASMGPQKLGYDIIGREGLALSAKWGVEGPKTFEGYCSQGFPNLFMQNAPQGTFTCAAPPMRISISICIPIRIPSHDAVLPRKARLRTLAPPQPSSHAARVLDRCSGSTSCSS